MVSHRWLPRSRSPEFTASHLSCASFARVHYQVVVRCTGSFRLDAGNRHLHRYYKFAVPLVKTAPRSLRHSCRSELTRQGISLSLVTSTCVEGLSISVNLCISPCSSDYIFTCDIAGAWR